MPSSHKLTAKKAKTILRDKSVKGHSLTSKQKAFFGAIAGGAKPYKRKTITLPKKELVEEHKELVKTLKHGSKSQLKKEAKEQSKELTQYKTMRKKRQSKMDKTEIAFNAAAKNPGAVPPKRKRGFDPIATYQATGKGLENVGANIRQNLIAGQKGPSASKASTVINPLKGSVAAFKAAFPKKRATTKLEKGMRGYKK